MGLRLKEDEWVVRPDGNVPGRDVILRHGVVVGKILWLRDLRYPSMCRIRMSAALAGTYQSPRDERRSWTAAGAERVWLLLHNGAVCGELHWRTPGQDQLTERVVAGLNMLPGRRPEACEPLPIAPVVERHLRLVR